MWCGAVGFEGGFVPVLLVDEETAWFSLVPVYLKEHATGLLARLLGQLGENADHFSFAAYFCHPRYRQNHHRSLRSLDFGPRLDLLSFG